MRTQTTNRPGGLLLAGVTAVALMGGSAFTGATTFDDTADVQDVVGYGTTSVSGATVSSLDYTLTGTSVSGITVTFSDTFQAAPTVSIVVDDGTPETASCTAPTTTPFATWECTLASTTAANLSSTNITVEGAKANA